MHHHVNHLAHLYLAQPTVESRVGNLLGDFARGADLFSLPGPVRAGLDNHRAVDAFTDQHAKVRQAKALFSSQRRRFAGVALDVLFDHYLIRHWPHFSTEQYSTFVDGLYDDLMRGRPLMPVPMQRTTAALVEHDWFGAYSSLDNIGFALDRIASRIRFPNQFAGIIEELHRHDATLEAVFLDFFPELLGYVRRQQLESPSRGAAIR